jgi:uncharacterized protein (DUF1800 family)
MSVRKNVTWRVKAAVFGLVMLAAAHTAVAQTATLSNLVIADLSPGFTPQTRIYSIPRTAACAVPVTATLSNPALKLQIANGDTPSGTMRQAWVCDGRTKIDIVIYSGWTEVGRYTVNVVGSVPPPPPPPGPATLSSLVVADLSPAFMPATFTYSIPRPSGCALPVTATLSDPTLKLQIQNQDTPSGTLRQAYICGTISKVDVVIYKVWTEVGRYTINLVGTAPPPPPSVPTPPPPPAYEAPPTASLAPAPYTVALPPASPVDQQTAARFLGQASFGATTSQMASVQADGIGRWLNAQFKAPESTIPDGLDINALRGHVFANMAGGNDQLRQRVAFALGQIMVVSANKNTNGYEMTPWVRLLSKHAFGNYRTLLREVTIDPSMGKFLDLANSIGGAANIAPNENYPRELLQLFSIGIYKLNQNGTFKSVNGIYEPSYDQTTIREVARALSGWTYPTAAGATPRSQNPPHFVGVMEPRPASHDRAAKTIFGVSIPANQSVTADMEKTVDILFEHPNVPPFVATRLIRALVTSNPTPEYIGRIADVFADNGQSVRGDLRAVVEAILTDPEAALPNVTDGRLMDPILNTIALGRALDAQITDPGMFQYVLFNLGQHTLTPNSVFSFYSPLAPLPGNPGLYGPEFMLFAPALTVQRASFAWSLISNHFGSAFSVNVSPFVALANNPAALAELVNQKVLHGRMSDELRAVLISSAEALSDPTQRALGAIYLAAISSEFVVQTGA